MRLDVALQCLGLVLRVMLGHQFITLQVTTRAIGGDRVSPAVTRSGVGTPLATPLSRWPRLSAPKPPPLGRGSAPKRTLLFSLAGGVLSPPTATSHWLGRLLAPPPRSPIGCGRRCCFYSCYYCKQGRAGVTCRLRSPLTSREKEGPSSLVRCPRSLAGARFSVRARAMSLRGGRGQPGLPALPSPGTAPLTPPALGRGGPAGPDR